MPNVLALTAKPIVARLTPNFSTRDGRIACAAKRSTRVRKAMSAMRPKRALSAAIMRKPLDAVRSMLVTDVSPGWGEAPGWIGRERCRC
jgi:hypothetical protein